MELGRHGKADSSGFITGRKAVRMRPYSWIVRGAVDPFILPRGAAPTALLTIPPTYFIS